MAGTEHLREVLGQASDELADAAAPPSDTERLRRLTRAGSYARGVLDAVAAQLADEDQGDVDEDEPARSTARRRDPSNGRFLPSEHAQALRDGTAAPS